MTFFDSTPTGRILNRFSSDVACADDSLPFTLNILLANAAGLLGLLAVLGAGLPWLLLLLPPLSALYYRVQRRYRASSRELRRLSSLTLSPLYTHLADTWAGLPVLRAAGATCRWVRAASRRGWGRREEGPLRGRARGGGPQVSREGTGRDGWVSAVGERGRKQQNGIGDSGRSPGPSVPLRRGLCVCRSAPRKTRSVGKESGWVSGAVARPPFPPASPRFEEENQRLLELNQRCQFAAGAAIQWLDIRLQLMGATVVSAIAGIALVQHQQGLADPGATRGASLAPQKHVLPPTPPPQASPRTVLPTFHPPPRMCCDGHRPHFRVEETESQGEICQVWRVWD